MRVLIADDDPVSRKILETSLSKWGHETIVAAHGGEAWVRIQEDDAPRLLILDWIMPGVDGLEICRRVHDAQRHIEPHPYIILLTAKGKKEDIVEGLKAGADDYVSKPFDHEELRARVQAGERILDLQIQLLAAEEALRHQATHDALTGLKNRRAILDMLDHECSRAGRTGQGVCVVMVDVDHFKTVNDTHGHHVGDQVLKDVARRLAGEVRSYEGIGRYGGEEFLIILSPCDSPHGAHQAERLRRALADRAVAAAGTNIPITASFGVAGCDAVQPCNGEALIQAADAAMYHAKQAGRNRIELARAVPPADDGTRRPAWREEVRTAEIRADR